MTDKLFVILTEPKKIKKEIKRVSNRIEDLRLMMLPSAIRYDADKVMSSPSDPMMKFAERLDELEKEKSKLAVKYIESTDRVIDLSNELTEDSMKDVIQWRFIRSLKPYQIAKELGYSERQVYRIYGEAIEELEKLVIECQ